LTFEAEHEGDYKWSLKIRGVFFGGGDRITPCPKIDPMHMYADPAKEIAFLEAMWAELENNCRKMKTFGR
jgi:hypothetical protein